MTKEEKREYDRIRHRKWRAANPEKAREQSRKWHRENLEKSKLYARSRQKKEPERRRRYRYGVTEVEIVILRIAQLGCCAVCDLEMTRGNGKSAEHVDHDHVTGKVRALLCNGCNRALGFFKDDPDILERAAQYLRKHRG